MTENDVWFKKALAIEEHHPEEAIKYYNSIIEHSDTSQNIQKVTVNAYQNKGIILEKLGKHEESLECLEKAKVLKEQREVNQVKSEEEKRRRMCDDAFQLLMEGKYDESIQEFDELLEIEPKNAQAWYGKGTALLEQAKNDDDSPPFDICQESIECMDKVIEIDPEYAAAWYNKAGAYITEASFEEYEEETQRLNEMARECLEKALEIEPDSVRANFMLANILRDLGRVDESIEYVDKALEIEPKNESFLDFKGVAYGQLGMLKESVECFEKLIQINPKNAQAWYGKGVSLVEQVNPYPNNPTIQDKSMVEESIECMDKVIEIDPEYAPAWYNKGTACMLIGRTQESSYCLERSTELDPKLLSEMDNKN